MNIIESINDKEIFRNGFENLNAGMSLDTWASWQVFLKALFGLEMTPAEARKHKKHTGNKYIQGKISPVSYVISGRRSGKSRISSLLACYLATSRDWSKILSPGEKGYIFLIANDKHQAEELKDYISGILQESPRLRGLIKKELVWEIQLSNRITIRVATKNFRTLRGYTVISAIFEELAFWRSEESASPDYEVLAAVRPAMLTVQDSMLIGISSAYAKRGLLYDQYKKFYGKASGPLIWKSTTVEMNPLADKQKIAEDIKSDPARYRSEYLSEFRSDIESYLSIDDLDKITDKGISQRPPEEEHDYFAFCDPSGGKNDSMTLAIAHKDYETDKAILDLLLERKSPFSIDSVVEEFSESLRYYGLDEVTADNYAADWPPQAFKKQNIYVQKSKLTKGQLYIEFVPACMSEKAVLLDNKRLRIQFSNLERRIGSSGQEKIDHPKGNYHDDLSNSVAGAIYLARKGYTPIGEMIVAG